MLGLYACVMAIQPLREFFELVSLQVTDYALIGFVVILWALLLRVIWRGRLLERLLSRE